MRKRPLWRKSAVLIAFLFAFSGAVETVSGWLSGSTIDDIAKAAKNVHDWAASTPILNQPAIQAFLFSIGGILLALNVWIFFRREPEPVSHAPSEYDNPRREKRRMECNRCDGTGQMLYASALFLKFRKLCTQCKGHGSYTTDLWSQPDCVGCKGTGRTYGSDWPGKWWHSCALCEGHGKRPFDPIIPSEREKKLTEFLSSFRSFFASVI